MRIISLSIILILFNNVKLNAQSRELGLLLGGAYYIGDLNPVFHFYGTRPAIGILFRKHINYRYAYKVACYFGQIQAKDKNSFNQFQRERNLDFKSRIVELSGQLEFNFLKYHGDDPRYPFSPFVFIGFGVFNFYPKGSLNNRWEPLRKNNTESEGAGGIYKNKQYSLIQPAIPFGVGLRYAINKRFNLSFEWALRKTFTDYLDDVSRYYPTPASLAATGTANTTALADKSTQPLTNFGRQRGNFSNKDWYSFAGIVFSLKFPDPAKKCPAYN
jgi:hypothetical protein